VLDALKFERNEFLVRLSEQLIKPLEA